MRPLILLIIIIGIGGLVAAGPALADTTTTTTPAINISNWVVHEQPNSTFINITDLLNPESVAAWYYAQVGMFTAGVALVIVAAGWLKTKSGPILAGYGVLLTLWGYEAQEPMLQSVGITIAAAGTALTLWKYLQGQ